MEQRPASWQSRAFELGMRMIGLKQRLFGDSTAIEKTIRKYRKDGPAKPGRRLRERFVIDDRDVAGRNVTVVTPRQPPERSIVYLHGGGFIMPITPFHWQLIARLAFRLNARVVVPDYPLAPESTALAINAWLVDLWRGLVNEFDPGRVSVMGDSAGGHLALSLVQQARDLNLPQPSSVVLFSAALTGHADDPRRIALDRTDCMIALSGMPTIARLFHGGLDPTDPRVDLLAGSLRGLPPLAAFSGTREIMHFDALRLQERALAEDVVVEMHTFVDMFHAWPIFPIPEARRAVDLVGTFVRQHERRTA